MNWTNESPGLRQQFTHSSCLHLCEILASMNAAEMRQVSDVVKLISDNGETGSLLKIELRSSHKVAGCEEILELLSNSCLSINQLF